MSEPTEAEWLEGGPEGGSTHYEQQTRTWPTCLYRHGPDCPDNSGYEYPISGPDHAFASWVEDHRAGWPECDGASGVFVPLSVIDYIQRQRDKANAAVAEHGLLAEGFFHAFNEVLGLLGVDDE